MNDKPFIVLMPEAVGDAVCATAPLNKLLNDSVNKRDVFLICSTPLLDIFNNIKGVKEAFTYDEIPNKIFSISFEWVIDLYSVLKTIKIASNLNYSNYIHRSISKSQVIEVWKTGKSHSFPAPIFNSDGIGREANPEEPAWALEAPLIAYVLKVDFWKWIDEKLEPKLQFKTKLNNSARNNHFKNSIIIIPCGSANAKRWPIHHWLELIKRLQNEKYNIHIFLGPLEKGIYPEFHNLSAVKVHQSLDLREISELVNYSIIAIGNDCGPMHVAASQNVCVLTIFGPTNPKCWFCYTNSKKQYIQLEKAKEISNSWGIINIDKKWEYWVSASEVFSKTKEMIRSSG